MGNSPGLFDVDDWLRRLSKIGDHLEAYASAAVVRPGPDVQGPDRPGAEQSQRLIRHQLTRWRPSAGGPVWTHVQIAGIFCPAIATKMPLEPLSDSRCVLPKNYVEKISSKRGMS